MNRHTSERIYMAELTRCQNLVTASIFSAADIRLDTPHGNPTTSAIPTQGRHVSNKMYVDAAIANLTIVGVVSACYVLTGVYFVNGVVVLPAPQLGTISVVVGLTILLSGDIPAGLYTASSPTTLVQTYALTPNDAVFVTSTDTIWFLQKTMLVAYTKQSGGTVTLYPSTANFADILAGPGTFILSAGVYVVPATISMCAGTTVVGYGATLDCAGGYPAILLDGADAVTLTGLTISGTSNSVGIHADNCHAVVVRDCAVLSPDIGVLLTNCTACSLDHVAVQGATQLGIAITASSNVLVRSSVISGSAVGIMCSGGAADIIITGGVIWTNTTGVQLGHCASVIIADSHIYRNTTGVGLSAMPGGASDCIVGGLIMQNATGIDAAGADDSNVLSGVSRRNTSSNISGRIGQIGTPAGMIQILPAQTVPIGWLLCDGASYLKTTYADLYRCIGVQFGATETSFNVPDLRGMFVRGYTPAESRGFATVQLDAFKTHTHDVAGAGLVVVASVPATPSINTYTADSDEPGILLPVQTMLAVGDSETRPVNVNLNYIIKF